MIAAACEKAVLPAGTVTVNTALHRVLSWNSFFFYAFQEMTCARCDSTRFFRAETRPSSFLTPWTPWSGERGWMGTVSPPLKRRRGTQGLYAQPRNVIANIPGVDFVEMIRIRENAFCCGAGRGTKEAFPTLASSSAKHRLEEVKEIGAEVLVSACPWCKNNFSQAAREGGDAVRVMDFSELIAASLDA